MLRSACVVAATLVAAGCASHPDNVEARYVSPIPYATWSCEQLAGETIRLTAEVTRVGGLQREHAAAEFALFAVGMVAPIPIPMELVGPKDPSAELSRLKGEYAVVEQTAKTQQCPAPGPAPA